MAMNNYNVVETTKVTGSCFSFVYDKDIENGSLIAKGELVKHLDDDGEVISIEREIYEAKVPAAGDEVFLVANPAWSYCDCRVTDQNEENYIIKAGTPFRAYQLEKHNKFGVEDYGVTATGDIAIDDYVGVDGTTVKIKDVGTSAPSLPATGFVGKVVEIEEYGFAYTTGTAGNVGKVGKKVIVEVVKNATVEA